MRDAIFEPRSVAVVGASRKPESIGWRICRNVVAGGFEGQLFPVNPRYAHVQATRCWPSVDAIPERIDLAVLAVPAGDVLEAARSCAEKGVRGLVVISAGFAERVGEEGEALQDELVALCRERGIRLVGPNALGVANTEPGVRLNATAARTAPPRGRVAFMTRSGAVGEAALARAARSGLGFSMVADVGNAADVSAVDLLEVWREDSRTDVVILYGEPFADPGALVPALRRTARDKPVLVVHAGRSATIDEPGATLTPTANLDDLLAACGVLRVRSISEAFAAARTLASQPLPAGDRVAVIADGHGHGVLAARAVRGEGLRLATLSEETARRIEGEVHAHARIDNPVDLLPGATPRHFGVAVGGALADEAIDAVLAISAPPTPSGDRGVLEAITEASKASDKPLVACVAEASTSLEGGGGRRGRRPPLYAFPEDAAAALGAMARYGRWREAPPGEPVPFEDVQPDRVRALVVSALVGRRRVLTTEETFRLLSAYGIPTTPGVAVASPHAARRAAEQTGYPVALRVASERPGQASDVRRVVLDLRDGDALEAAMLRLHEELSGRDPELTFSVQPVSAAGAELRARFTTDPLLGPVVGLASRDGLGGSPAWRVAPLARRDAEDLIDRACPGGAAGSSPTPVVREILVDTLLRLGWLAVDFPEITDLDLDPLVASSEAGAVRIADARARLIDSATL